jgi:hypothetical protein
MPFPANQSSRHETWPPTRFAACSGTAATSEKLVAVIHDFAIKSSPAELLNENYRFVRTMQQLNVIVPIVDDFTGPKAIKAVGKKLLCVMRNDGTGASRSLSDFLESDLCRLG